MPKTAKERRAVAGQVYRCRVRGGVATGCDGGAIGIRIRVGADLLANDDQAVQRGTWRVTGYKRRRGGLARDRPEHGDITWGYYGLGNHLIDVDFAIICQVERIAGHQGVQQYEGELVLAFIEDIVARVAKKGRIAFLARHDSRRIVDDATLQIVFDL